MRVGARGDKAAVGQHDIGRHKIVDCEAESPGEVADSAAEGQSANSRGGDEARWQRHSERTGGMINIPPDTAAVDSDGAGHRVN